MRYRPSIRLVYAIHFLFACACGFLVGCEPPELTENGVIRAFGSVGLGDGDFSYPRAIAADSQGCVYVVDKSGRVQRFSKEGNFEIRWKMPEIAKGKPVGLSVHPDGRVFVADTHYSRVIVYGRDGELLGSFGENGLGPGQFQLPTDIAFDDNGQIYVAEYSGDHRIQVFSPEFQYLSTLCDFEIDGEYLRRPSAIAIDEEQTMWIADACNHRLVRLSLTGEVLGVYGEYGAEPGQLRFPYDLAITPDGQIMVCEYEGNRLQWFTKKGESVRLWGESGREPGQLFSPWGATYGAEGLVYIVDSLNSRIQIVRPK